MCADLTLLLMEAKDERHYWTDGTSPQTIEETKFLLIDLPDDWRVTVDSHSSSPIFANENEQLIFASHKEGIVDDEYVLENIQQYPNKEAAIAAAKERKANKARQMQQLLQEFPEVGEKLALKTLTGGKR